MEFFLFALRSNRVRRLNETFIHISQADWIVCSVDYYAFRLKRKYKHTEHNNTFVRYAPYSMVKSIKWQKMFLPFMKCEMRHTDNGFYVLITYF